MYISLNSYIAHSLSLSTSRRPDMTETMLKRRKLASHPSVDKVIISETELFYIYIDAES